MTLKATHFLFPPNLTLARHLFEESPCPLQASYRILLGQTISGQMVALLSSLLTAELARGALDPSPMAQPQPDTISSLV